MGSGGALSINDDHGVIMTVAHYFATMSNAMVDSLCVLRSIG